MQQVYPADDPGRRCKTACFWQCGPKTEEMFLSESHTTYYGRCQMVIYMENNRAKITVGGENLKTVIK